MNHKKVFTVLSVLGVLLTGCNKNSGDNTKEEQLVEKEFQKLEVMSVNLDQGHQNSSLYHKKVIDKISSVMPDLLGVQEEGDGWVNALKDSLEEYGYKHIYKTRGGSFSEASGIFINMDRFEIKESGTFWFGTETNENTEAHVASYWGAMYPRVCTWSVLHDKYVDKDIAYFNAHYEYNHPKGKDGTATADDNTVECRKNSSLQVIKHMKEKKVPGFFTGDLNFFRETEPETYNVLLDYFDDSWADFEGHQEMCTFHNYGKELDPETRKNPYSPIDYIFSTKGDFKVNNFTIMNNEGTREEDFDSDHFFVHANFSYKDLAPDDEPHSEGEGEGEDNPPTPPTPPTPIDDKDGITVMSANLDQGHQNNSYYHSKVLSEFDKVKPDLLGVQEEGDGWTNALTNAMKEKGYTHIVQSRGGSFPEASGIFIKDSRFEVKESGTFWFCEDPANESKNGYVATEWGASFPRICTWALLHDKVQNKDISYFNAHLEYDHEFGNLNGTATPESNTIACRMNSCRQVIRHAKSLGVPAFFTGDLNSFRSLEPAVYNTCLNYFDDSWAKCGSQAMCTFHDYGKELDPNKRTHPFEPIDYIYSTKGKFTANSFTIMSNNGTSESDFDSDHFFIYSNFSYN